MFKTKSFSHLDVDDGQLDNWLNSLQVKGYGVRVVSQVVIPENGDRYARVFTTVSVWKLGEIPETAGSVRSTIDVIPEEPAIQYPDGDNDEQHGTD